MSIYLWLGLLFGMLYMQDAAGVGLPMLSIEERVDCERSIQGVYWQHRTHGQSGVGGTFEFDRDAARVRVIDALKHSAVLDTQWAHPLTPAAIKAEFKRIERDSRDRETLQDVYAALRDDPVLIGECLLRPMLAERLSHTWYQHDRAIHAVTREAAEQQFRALQTGANDVAMVGASRQRVPSSEITQEDLRRLFGAEVVATTTTAALLGQLEGQTSSLKEQPESFDAWHIAKRDGEVALEHWSWPKRPFEAWWRDVSPNLIPDLAVIAPSFNVKSSAKPAGDQCVIGEWSATRVEDDFYARWSEDSTAVWTGSEMLVFGRPQVPVGEVPGSTGGLRYTPATDSWQPMSHEGQFQNVYYSEGVWSGTELLLFGGCHPNPENPNTLICSDRIGARYNPATDTWRSMSTVNAPSVDVTRALQWLGDRMFSWGGGVGAGAAATYDPVSDTWTPVASPPESRHEHYSLWTGDEVLIFGGFVNGTMPTDVNLAYKPSTNTWRTLSAVNAPSLGGSRGGFMRAWSGTEAFVFAEIPNTASVKLYRYNPAQDAWTHANTTGMPSPRIRALATWAGDRLVVWGGQGVDGVNGILGNGAMYLPQADSWLPIRSDGAPTSRTAPFGVWTGSDLIVWGGLSGEDTRSGARLNVGANTWTPISDAYNGAPSMRRQMASTSDGELAYIWSGGDISGYVASTVGGVYSPALDSWTQIGSEGAPSRRFGAYAAFTDEGFLVFGGNTPQVGAVYDGGIYDPATRIWTAISEVPWDEARTGHVTDFSSGKLVVWGGLAGTAYLDTGYVYDVAARSWSAMSVAFAAAARVAAVHAAHGGKIYVWGGSGPGLLTDGGIYDPAENAWTPMMQSGDIPDNSSTNQINSYSALFVDAGDFLVLYDWGSNRAWSYEIASGVWRRSTMKGRPAHAQDNRPPTAVWSGRELLFWGGNQMPTGWLTNGYGYDPATDVWRDLETENSPGGRVDHAGLAVGSSMLIWGGVRYDPSWGSALSAEGGRYCMDTRTGPLSVDLVLDMRFEQPVVSLGSAAILELRSRNDGPDVATQIQVDTDTGSNFVFLDVDQPSGASCTTPVSGAGGAISCTLGSEQPGASKTIRVMLSAFSAGAYTFSGSLIGLEDDSDPLNNMAAAAVDVIGAGDAIFSSGFE